MTVNLSLLAGAGAQFFDDNGVPLAGGFLYTYSAGSTTPATTYINNGGITQNSNPIVLDAAGRVPYEIWLTEGLNYKFVLKDSTNAEIWTKDNISGATDGYNLTVFEAALANTTDVTKGDALVGFRQSNSSGAFTGAVARTVHDKLQEFISVKDFGAVGDGVTDDTAAITNAINAANFLAINKTYAGSTTYVATAPAVYFPIGTYLISSTIVPSSPTSSLTLIGDGKSILIGTGTKSISPFSFTAMRYLTIKNIHFQNFNTALTISSGNLDLCNYIFENVCGEAISLFLDTVSYAASRSTNVAFYSCEFQYEVVKLANLYCDNVSFYSCWLGSGSGAEYIKANSSLSFYSCVFIPAGTDAIGRCWVLYTNTNGSGGTSTDQFRGVAFYKCRVSNEGANCPLVVNDYPQSSQYITTPCITFDSCELNGYHSSAYESGGTETGIVQLLQYPASIKFSNCGFVVLGGTNYCLVGKNSTLTTTPPASFLIDMDDASYRNAQWTVGESSTYTLAVSLRNWIRNPDPACYGSMIENGNLHVVSGTSSGQVKTTFTVNSGYNDATYQIPMCFYLILTGQGNGTNNNYGYAGSSIYLVTINGYYDTSIKTKITATKLSGTTWGLASASNSDIVNIGFGTSESAPSTIATASTYTVTCVFGANSPIGRARLIPLINRENRYGEYPN